MKKPIVKRRTEFTTPKSFRKILRRIVRETIPIVITSSTLALSCNINVNLPQNPSPKDAGTKDSIFIDHAKETKLPEQKLQDVFASNIPPNQRLDTCPLGSECNQGEHSGRYSKKLKATDPNPLSYQECIRLCKQKLTDMCQDDDNGEHQLEYHKKIRSCLEVKDSHGNRQLRCDYTLMKVCAVAGRRPTGLQEEEQKTTEPANEYLEAGQFFAELAFLEEAAIVAFRYLTKELEAYNAPAHLILLAKQAVDEEIEHAEMMKGLASRYNSKAKTVKVKPFQLRSLGEIAFENAREGCMREAYGSLMAMWQAETAEDPAVQAVMERISYEESAHAALSFAIDEWIRPQLSKQENIRYTELRSESLEMLKQEILEEPSPALVKHAGYPPKEVGIILFEKLYQETLA